MFEITDSVVDEANELVKTTVHEMCKTLRKPYNDLPLPSGWKPKVKCVWSGKQKISYGGINGITLAMKSIIMQPNFVEYASIDKDPTIGGFETQDWRIRLKAVIAHELAHAAGQYIWIEKDRNPALLRTRHGRIDYVKAHGDGWRRIYALLRSTHVNQYI